MREGFPLRRADWQEYLGWAVDACHLAASGVRDDAHSHAHVGPGVWDIHSPRVPSADEMFGLIRAAAKVIPKARLW